MKKHIPNILTLSNLFAGCIGLVFAFDGNLAYASYAIWIAAIFDFFDGFSARMLKVSSPIGKELDSLADMVTFGVLPSVILFQMIESLPIAYLGYGAFILALFSALRLAKFNVDTRQATTFIGMPTPAAAFFVSGLPFWLAQFPQLGNWYVILAASVILALLLVSPIRMLALKFENYSLGVNWHRYLLIIVSIILFAFFSAKSLPLIIILYLIISLVSPRPKLQ